MSKKKYNHQFSNYALGQAGSMICSCCGEKITSGDFLYAKQNLPHDDWQYVSWHRKCSSFADWNSEDKNRMNQIHSLESTLHTLLDSKTN